MTPIDLLKFVLPDFLLKNFEIVSAANSEENRIKFKCCGQIYK
jgi:hypothetical protein